MQENVDNLFINIRNTIISLIEEKNININLLSYDLKIDTETFIENLSHRIPDFTFYLKTLSLVENWEG